MSGPRLDPGVYRRQANGSPALVHAYLDDGYELAELHGAFGLGVLEHDGGALRLSRTELRRLKVDADAYSFDHAPQLIAMCLDIARVELDDDEDEIQLLSIG